MLKRFGLAALLILGACAIASAEEGWLLTTAQFKTDSVALKGLDASGVKIVPLSGGAPRTILMDDFLDLTRALPPAQGGGRFVLHLAGGDRLSGDPVGLKGDSLIWKNADIGEITIPGSQLVGITPPTQPAPAERRHEDTVRLSNGDVLRGIVSAMTADSITVQTSGGNSDVPMNSVASLTFAMTPGAASPQRGFRIRLDDGSSLVGSDARLEGDHLVLTTGKNADHQIDLSHVTTVEQVNGPVSWLSARPPAEAVYYRFLGGPQEPAAYMDRQWGGHRRIDFKGRLFAHGIGVHAFSRITWALNGQYSTFHTRYAIESDAGGIADATVRIRLDEKVVYEKAHVRSGRLSPVIYADLKGAKKLTLEVDGAAAYAQDALDWIEPALLKQKPPQTPATEPDDAENDTQPADAPASQPSAGRDVPSRALTVTHVEILPQFEVNANADARTLPPTVNKTISKCFADTRRATDRAQ